MGGTSKELLAGTDLLSRGLAARVPSALAGLTTGFGMGPGISPPLQAPEELLLLVVGRSNLKT